jgi:hypothetical protein
MFVALPARPQIPLSPELSTLVYSCTLCVLGGLKQVRALVQCGLAGALQVAPLMCQHGARYLVDHAPI